MTGAGGLVYKQGVPARGAPDVFTAIAHGSLDPIYCLHGPERYLIDRCLAALRSAVLGEAGASGLNHELHDLAERGVAPVLSAARTLPMFAARRLVVGTGVDLLASDELNPLCDYAADPNPSTCLVLVADKPEKLDGRLHLFQALKQAGYLHEFARLRDQEIPGWLAREAARRNLAIDRDAAQALAEAAGPDLGRLAHALEQLALYLTPDARILARHVEELIPETRERGVFELLKAIGEADLARALRLLGNLLRNREKPLRIEFMLLRQLRQIWRARELGARGLPRAELAAAIRIPPYFLNEILAPARRMSDQTLRRSFVRLYESDRRLKSSRVDPDVQIARLVVALVRDAAGTGTGALRTARRS